MLLCDMCSCAGGTLDGGSVGSLSNFITFQQESWACFSANDDIFFYFSRIISQQKTRRRKANWEHNNQKETNTECKQMPVRK